MELDIKQILSEYKKLDYSKNLIQRLLIKENYESVKSLADSYGFQNTNKLSDLDSNFYPVLESLFELLNSSSCKVNFTSGKRPLMSNPNSLHPKGRAIDFVFIDNVSSCVNYMTQICNSLNSKYPGVGCLNEYPSYGGKKSKDWSGDHFHIHFSGQAVKSPDTPQDLAAKQNKPTNTATPSLNFDQEIATQIGKQVFGQLMSSYQIENKDVLSENFYFGKRATQGDGYYTIPSQHNPIIKSPISGIIVSDNLMGSRCVNSITIKNSLLDTKLQYCNLSEKLVNIGDRIVENQEIGKSNDRVDTIVYLEFKKQDDTTNNSDNEKGNKNNDEDYEEKLKRQRLRTSGDPVAYQLASWPLDLYRHLTKKKKDKEEKEEKTESKINENIERIKKLL
jgi:hypothetical protein